MGSGRRSRSQDAVVFLECFVKFFLDQAFGAQCFHIIGIVVTGTQYERSQKNSSFYFLAEAFRTTLFVHFMQFCRTRGTVAVFYTVETLQVGACFRTGDDIICRNYIIYHSQGEEFYYSTVFTLGMNGICQSFFHFFVTAFCQIFFWNTDAHAA